MTKHLIRVYGVANSGKTQSIAMYFLEYVKKGKSTITPFPNRNLPSEPIWNGKKYRDFVCIVELDGVKIGIYSYGDPETTKNKKPKKIYQIISYFMKIKCDLIIGASRTRGDTCKIYKKLLNKHSQYNETTIGTQKYRNNKNAQGKEHLRIAADIHVKAKAWFGIK